jgi:hypothetical protein
MHTALARLLPQVAHEILAAPTGTVGDTVHRALASVADAVDVPWIKLNGYREAQHVRPLAEWIDPAHAARFTPPGIDQTLLGVYPWFRTRLLELNPIQTLASDLPPEAALERERPEKQGAAWILLLPTADAAGLRAGLVLRDHRPR